MEDLAISVKKRSILSLLYLLIQSKIRSDSTIDIMVAKVFKKSVYSSYIWKISNSEILQQW